MEHFDLTGSIDPDAIRLEASSLCQLRCPLCPRTRGETQATVGNGALELENFRGLIDANPGIRKIEFGNFGEVFLNPDLPRILEYAFDHRVETLIDEGANLNDATDEAQEAVVKYRTTQVRCALDAVTQETYEKYRIGGNLRRVIANIGKINGFKASYGSSRPKLVFQFVIFNYNEHEMEHAELLARMLGMEVSFKLNFFPNALPVQNREGVPGGLAMRTGKSFSR